MFSWFKKKEKKEVKEVIKLPTLIFIHGFGKRRTDEFIPLYNALKDKYHIVMPELYNQAFENDKVWHNWVSKAEEKVIEAKNNHEEIILVGFSMGGVIASYLASKFSIKKLVLIAPAFEYLNFQTASSVVKKGLQKKVVDPNDKYLKIPAEFNQTFMDVVDNCKKGIEHVNCPVLFIAAANDELIPYTVSMKYYKKVPHNDKKCVILMDGQHRILDDDKLSKMTISIIQDFIEDRYN